MKIQAISPRGYCYGVINAIKTAKQARLDHPTKQVYILGMIVHNKFIVESLESLNIITLDDKETTRDNLIDVIKDGVVILSAHGSAQSVKDKAINKGLIVYDATCQDVIKTHDLMESYINDGYDIIYLGKANHPEAIAACSISNHIHLITDEKDVEKLNINNDKIFITNQTTISVLEAKEIFDLVQRKYPKALISQEICNATRVRQNAILNMDDDVDIVYVVGDPHSNNSNKLAKLAQTRSVEVHMIESVEDIEINDLVNKSKAAITSGASTPTYLTNQVIKFLENFNADDKHTYLKPIVDINKILD